MTGRAKASPSDRIEPHASADGWHVVTSVDTVIGQEGEPETHTVVRFSSVLLPGESQLISIALATGER